MNTKLLSNRELENYSLDDSFDFKVKADAIKYFLEYNSTTLEKNKMLVLYGDWGSGKTSLMRHIEKEINKGIYFPVFFQAWEHEKDENLPLSLCDLLMDSVTEETEAIKQFMKGALITLKSFASGITLKTPSFLPGIELEFSGEKVIKAVDEAFKDSNPKSFYKSNEEFKTSFRAIEDLILKKWDAQKILIFVDDLDRCEPENVLNLITALKLFFTYGEKCVFLCGVDKEAVTKAVKTRYKDVIKSDEYMEKVFDITFNMPKTFSLKKLLEPHFFNLKVSIPSSDFINSIDIIEDFFISLRFSNPRHIKKVLNKYEILKAFKKLNSLPREFKDLIPDIILEDKVGKIFETIYCLYIIILYEFYTDEFKDIENYNQKMVKYLDILSTSRQNYSKNEAANELDFYIRINDFENSTFHNIMADTISKTSGSRGFSKIILFFSNSNPSMLRHMADNELDEYIQYFTDDKISTNFCKFLIRNKDIIIAEDSDYKPWSLFGMAKYLL